MSAFFIYIKHYVYSFMRFLYIITLYKFYFLFRLFGITEMFCRFVMYNGESLAQCDYLKLKNIKTMNAKEFLESKHIEDRVLNSEDLPEFWVTISQLLNEFEALRQPSYSRRIEDYPEPKPNILLGGYIWDKNYRVRVMSEWRTRRDIWLKGG